MHRSRVSTLLIDVPIEHAAKSATFWSAAVGGPTRPESDEEQFIAVPDAVPGLVTAVQAVDDAPRYHLDFETDDVDAETARLSVSVLSRSRSGRDAGPSKSRVVS